MAHIGWDDQGDTYTAWDRIRDERRAEAAERQDKVGGGRGKPKTHSTGHRA